MSGAFFGQFEIYKKRLCLSGGCVVVSVELKLHLMGPNPCNLLCCAALILETRNITCRVPVRVVELFSFSQVLILESTFLFQTRSLQCHQKARWL
jgi:hypothetical protein